MDSTAAAARTVGAKSAESNLDTPTAGFQPCKPLPSSNGVLKRNPSPALGPAAAAAVIYKDCLRNHAASLGGYAVDGCGEFLPSPSATAADPTSLKCAACGCHRNFHRRVRDSPPPPPRFTEVLEFHSHHRHHPLPPSGSPESPSPPPISSSYVPSAPHMLLALSAAANSPAIDVTPSAEAAARGSNLDGRKRFRTRFSPAQKEKMRKFAETVGWKMQKKNEELMTRFCGEVGVDRGVFKVWMHNNKNTLRKRNVSDKNGSRRNSHRIIADDAGVDGASSPNYDDDHIDHGGGAAVATATEPSSSS